MKKGKVWFVGAGPGDPELVTLKGRRLLDEADVIVYAGSLVNPGLLRGVKAELHDSAGMELEEITNVLVKAASGGKLAVRLHSGDISFYSAISEQIDVLKKEGIAYEVVPGVSSLGAGAAALGQELTIPEVSQSVIVTRMAGRTPVPELEGIRAFASHRSTMVVFLSVGMMEKLTMELIDGGYPADTPVAVVEKASWPGQKILRGRLRDIAEKVKQEGITKTALIYVGEAIGAPDGNMNKGKKSRLYDKDFSHGTRKKR